MSLLRSLAGLTNKKVEVEIARYLTKVTDGRLSEESK